MSVFGLCRLEGERISGGLSLLSGGRTGLLGTSREGLALFSSDGEASRFAFENHLEGVEVKGYEGDIGHLLAAACSLDHFTTANLDGIPIGVFSCASGGYILPSHFYRKTEHGIATLYNGGIWKPEKFDPHAPTCGCGNSLIPYSPRILKIPTPTGLLGFWQVLAATCLYESGPTFTGNTSVFVDMDRPKSSFYLELVVGVEKQERYLFGVNPVHGETFEEAGTFPFAWDVCPYTDTVRLSITTRFSSERHSNLTINLYKDRGHAQKSFPSGQIYSTGKTRVPALYIDELSMSTKEYIENVLGWR